MYSDEINVCILEFKNYSRKFSWIDLRTKYIMQGIYLNYNSIIMEVKLR
jgi:hypothetical protein